MIAGRIIMKILEIEVLNGKVLTDERERIFFELNHIRFMGFHRPVPEPTGDPGSEGAEVSQD